MNTNIYNIYDHNINIYEHTQIQRTNKDGDVRWRQKKTNIWGNSTRTRSIAREHILYTWDETKEDNYIHILMDIYIYTNGTTIYIYIYVYQIWMDIYIYIHIYISNINGYVHIYWAHTYIHGHTYINGTTRNIYIYIKTLMDIYVLTTYMYIYIYIY